MINHFKIGQLVRFNNNRGDVGFIAKTKRNMFAVKLIDNHDPDLEQFLDEEGFLWSDSNRYSNRFTVYPIVPDYTERTK